MSEMILMEHGVDFEAPNISDFSEKRRLNSYVIGRAVKTATPGDDPPERVRERCEAPYLSILVCL